MSRRLQKLIIALITIVPVIVMALYGMIHFANQVRKTLEHTEWIVADELSRQWGRDVKVGKSKVIPLGLLTLEDVVISGRPDEGGDLLVAKKIRIKYDWRGLLFNNLGAQSISSVELINPKIRLVRARTGAFNIVELFKPKPGPPRPPFQGVVRIIGGDVIFRDYRVGTGAKPVDSRVSNLTGTLDASQQPKYAFNASGESSAGRFGKAQITGVYQAKNRNLAIDLNAKNVSAPFLKKYITPGEMINVQSGVMDITAGISARFGPGAVKTSLNGVARVKNLVVTSPSLANPIKNVNGSIVMTGNRVVLRLLGNLAGASAKITGVITDFENPKLNLYVSAPAVEFPGLIQALKIPGIGPGIRVAGVSGLAARITGTSASPIVSFSAKAREASAFGYTIRNAAVSAVYSQGKIYISSSTFTILGAPASVSGVVETKSNGAIALKGRVQGFPIASLPLPSKPDLRGLINADFSITGTINNPTAVADAYIRSGVIDGVAFKSASIKLQASKSAVRVSSLAVNGFAGGSVRASGSIAAGKINLAFVIRDLNLSAFQRALGLPDLAGTLFASGYVSGSIDSPAYKAAVEVYNGNLDKYAFDYLQLAVNGNRNSVTIDEGTLRILPSSMDFSGKLSGLGSDRITFQIASDVRRLDVKRIEELTGTTIKDVTGTLTANITASGVYLLNPPSGTFPLQNTSAFGTVTLEDGMILGYPIENAGMEMVYENGVLIVTNASATSAGAKISLGGQVYAEREYVDLHFSLQDFNLSRLSDAFRDYVSATGVVNAIGTIKGPFDDIAVSVTSNLGNLVLNGARFDSAEIIGQYSKNIITTASATFKKGSQTYQAQATDYDINTNCLESAVVTVSNGSVPDLWEILNSSPPLRTEQAAGLRKAIKSIPAITKGTLNLQASIEGCLENPNGKLSLTAANIGGEMGQVDEVDIGATSVNGVVTLDRFTATSDSMVVTATGNPLYQDGKINLQFSANNFDLSRLRAWLGENAPNGVLTADFVVEGNVKAPAVMGSIEVVNPGYKGINFDRLRISRVEVAANKINFSDIILASAGNEVVARGYLPWSWPELTVPSNQPLEFSAALNKQDLAVLATFIPQVDIHRTSGPVLATFSINGTLAEPVLDGKFQITDGKIGLKNFTNDFTNINVDMALKGTSVVINQMTALSSLGGSINVPRGSINLSEAQPLDIIVMAKGLVLAEQNALGYGENIKMSIDAGLAVTGSLASPVIADTSAAGTAGGITISNAQLRFAVPGQISAVQIEKMPINPVFNVSVRMGQDVWVQPPNLRLLVGGSGALTGTLDKPVFKMELTAREGTLTLAATRLRVIPDGTIAINYSAPAAPVITLRNFRANTLVTAINALGRRDRYQITLTINGPVNNMQIDLASDPPGLSRAQMLAALGHFEGIFTAGETGLQEELASVLTAVGASTLFSPIEQLFVERLGFEQFSIEYSSLSPLSVYASRKLFDNVYVSVYRSLISDVTNESSYYYNYQLRISYRLRGKYEFSIGTNDQQETFVEVGYTTVFW